MGGAPDSRTSQAPGGGQEEKPHLKFLPTAPFRYFADGIRTVNDDTTITVDGSSYGAQPAPIGGQVLVRIYDLEIEIRDLKTQALIRTHSRAAPGSLRLPLHERPFNPSRQTHYLLAQAETVGPRTHEFCKRLFERQGRVSQKSMWGILGVAKKYPANIVEKACELALARGVRSSKEVSGIADSVFAEALVKIEAHEGKVCSASAEPRLTQQDPLIREGTEYDDFFNQAAREVGVASTPKKEKNDVNDNARDGKSAETTQALRSESDAGDAHPSGASLQPGLFGNVLTDPAGRARPASLAFDRAEVSTLRS